MTVTVLTVLYLITGKEKDPSHEAVPRQAPSYLSSASMRLFWSPRPEQSHRATISTLRSAQRRLIAADKLVSPNCPNPVATRLVFSEHIACPDNDVDVPLEALGWP